MTAVLRVELAGLRGTCGRGCYDASGPDGDCACVCRGVNHGAGERVAGERMAELERCVRALVATEERG